ncbi:unannotated protein [freshwater metagenome]|uniref:Unannotated protein n=1 Tax=freshwater metagenome TaxID=449393 RepID=A0A6J6CQS8_9ZZZZ
MNRVGISRISSLVAASFLAHLWALTASKVFPDAISFGDLSLYEYWAYQVENGAGVYGLATEWVYPALALVPIWIAGVINFVSYEISWLVVVFALNTSAALLMVRPASSGKLLSGTYTSWTFLGALLLLGPVAVSRIDSASAALAVFGLVAINRNSRGIAAALFTIAGWIKIWPIALFAALVTSFKKKVEAVVVATLISASIIGVGLLAGGTTVFSFVTQQQDRGIQIESVMATPWMWLAKFGLANIFFDDVVLTNQVSGPLAGELASVSNFILFVALGITAFLAIRAVRAGRDRTQVFVLAALTGVLDLIVFNKVGSPQFMIWVAVPLVALIYFGVSKSKVALAIGAAILLLTQFVYPIFYVELLSLQTLPLGLLTLRNVLLVALLVWANVRLSKKQDSN